MTSGLQRCRDVALIDRIKEYQPTAGSGPFHTHFRVWVWVFSHYWRPYCDCEM